MSRAKRHKQPAEDLESTLADIINSPITKSNLSFLVRPKSLEETWVQQRSNHSGKDSLSPDGVSATLASPNVKSASLTTGVKEHPVAAMSFGVTAPSSEASNAASHTVATEARVATGRKQTPVVRVDPGFKARLAQDAHTVWEQALYDALWNAASGDTNGPKQICAGYRTLAAQTRLGDKTVKRNLRSLEEKLAIEAISDENSHTSTGRTYRVFSFRQILERRRAAGLDWIIRNRQGVLLTLSPGSTVTTGVSSPTEVTLTPEATIPPGVREATGDSITIGRMVTVNTGAVVKVPIHLEKYLEQKQETTTTARALLQANLPTFDDTAVQQLWAECRRQVPDVTAEEVATLFQRKLPESRARGIENPNGFLLRAVARSCTAAAIGALRQGRELPKEVPRSLSSEELEQALNDPHTPLQLRAWIEQRLQEKKD